MNREELLLTASLTQVNQEITRYVLRVMDEDRGGGVTEYTRPIHEVERTLATNMAQVAQTLHARAEERGPVVVEGNLELANSGEELPVSLRRKPDLPEF